MSQSSKKLLRQYVARFQHTGPDGKLYGPSLKEAKRLWDNLSANQKTSIRREMARVVAAKEA